MLDGFFDIIAGSADGGGIFDALFSADFLEGAAGIFGDILGPGSSGALYDVLGEGEIFSHARMGAGMFEWMNFATDRAFDYLVWKDVMGNKGGKHNFWQAFAGEAKESIEGIRDVLRGHGFILQQLRAHTHVEGIPELLTEYEALGTHLPSEELLKKTHRALGVLLHPDQNKAAEAGEWMKQLNSARDAIKDSTKRGLYEDALRKNPGKIEELFHDLAGGKWQEAMSKAYRGAQKRIENMEKLPKKGPVAWFSKLHPTGKGAVIFGAVAGTGLGVYMLAKTFERPRRKDESDKPASFQERVTKHQPSSATAR